MLAEFSLESSIVCPTSPVRRDYFRSNPVIREERWEAAFTVHEPLPTLTNDIEEVDSACVERLGKMTRRPKVLLAGSK
jgi:hypothetical protein